jgi:RHS repeat-associated protein
VTTTTLARYQYDYAGRRTKKIADGVIQYLYDGDATLAEYSSAGVQAARYEWGGDRLVSLLRIDEPKRFYHMDGLGSVTALTDAAGASVAAYHWDAWGAPRDASELDASKNRFGFTGHLYDAESELVYAKARYFDPDFGRFLTQDSYLGDYSNPPSLHRYTYGWNRPTFYYDPDGNDVFSAARGFYEGSRRFVEGVHARYKRADAQVTERQGAELRDFIGMREAAVLGQFIRNLDQERTPAFGGRLGSLMAAQQSFSMNAAARALEMPSDAFAGLTNLVTPGGFASWNGGQESTDYAPIRKGQVEDLLIAGDARRAWYERGAAGAGAVLSVPLTVIEGLTWAPFTRASVGVGTDLYKAGAAADWQDSVIYTMQAGENFLTAFGIAGTVAAPFVPRPRPPVIVAPNSAAPRSLEYNIAPHGKQPSPRRGLASHHGVQQEYLKRNVPGYDPKRDPTLLLDDAPGGTHKGVTAEQATRRARVQKDLGNKYGADYGTERAAAIEQLRRAGVAEEKIGQWVLEHDAYLFELGKKR